MADGELDLFMLESEIILTDSQMIEMLNEEAEVTVIEAARGVISKSCRSVVWCYFTKISENDGQKCTLCQHVLRDCGDTTNLFKVTCNYPYGELF